MPFNERTERIQNIADKWSRVESLWGGTDSLKEAGREYLFQEPHEDDKNYKNRLSRSVLWNKYKKTVETSVGKVFTNPMVVDGLPVDIEDDLENIDAEGSTFNVFAKRMCTDAIHFGIGYIVVDFPINDVDVTDASPYWVRINPLSVLDISVDFINGMEVLTRFSFVETVSNYNYGTDEHSQSVSEQYKTFYLDEDLNPQFIVKNTAGHIIAQGPIVNGAGQPMSRLPVVPCYGEKVEPYLGSPVLMDLADLNLAHWQDYSDLRNINHITSLPMLLLKGQQEQYDENGNVRQITISPNSVITISDPQGSAEWIEHSGSSIGTNLTMLQHLEDKMSVMGLEMTAGTGGNETATGRVIDAAEAHSKLLCIALDLETALELALELHAEYNGIIDAEVKVIINTKFASTVSTEDMGTIMRLYNDGIITAKDVLEEAKARTLLTNENIEVAPVLPPDDKEINTDTNN